MKCAIVDERISDKCERALKMRGFFLIKLPPAKKLSLPMASHADMLIFSHGDTLIASADYCSDYPHVFSDIREFLPNIKMRFSSDVFAPEYPMDRIFNSLVIGNDIFIKPEHISSAVTEYAREVGLNTVRVNQGYPACTVLAFGNNAITADRGMAKALSEHGVSVSLISDGDILLPPYEYGFIGGAAGVYKKEVFFLGSLPSHKDFEKINEAILSAGYTPVSLSDEKLSDLGGIIFLD